MTAEEATTAEILDPPAPLDCGDWAWVVYWRSFPLGGNDKNGTWETGVTRIIHVGVNGVVAHEVTNRSTAADDGSYNESFTRWTPADKIFRTRDEAASAARDLPAPK